MAEETNPNQAGEVAPSNSEQETPAISQEHAPSASESVATDIPTANAPDPKAVNPDTNPNAAVEKSDKQPPAGRKPKAEPGAAPAAEGKPAKAKKEKAPALEDKPFQDFIQQDYLPALKAGLAKQGISNLELAFQNQPIPILGFGGTTCWQIVGRWQSGGQPRQFNIYFLSEDINGQKGFSYAESGGRPSTFESFLIDERKVTLDLLVFGAVQRLNAQKWLVLN